ncbi:5328_t:CDS:2 [Entrophospora sp. SA101]|nr:5328_t:CDS:2 [Entrophospora sp. SA101]
MADDRAGPAMTTVENIDKAESAITSENIDKAESAITSENIDKVEPAITTIENIENESQHLEVEQQLQKKDDKTNLPFTTHASDQQPDQQPVKPQDYDLLEARDKRKETNDPEVEEYFKAKELFLKGSKIAEEIPTDSEEKTLKEYEQKILESTKYLVEAFLIDEKATDMSSRIMNLAQQYEKLSKLQWGDENEKKENDETSTTHEPEFTKESLILVIWLLYNGRQFSFCIQTLNIALNQLESQLHPRLYHLRAICHFNLNDHKSCIKDLERLVSIKPDFVDAYSIQGSIHMSQGDRMEAARNFKLYIEKANKDSISYSHALYALAALTIQNNNSTTTASSRKQASHSLRNQQALNYYQKAKIAEERYEYLYGHPPDISEGSKVVEKDSKKEADKLAHILQRLLVLSSNANQQPPNKEKKCNCCGSQTRKDLNAEEKNTALLACSSCFSVNYCSKECQKKDWKNGHRKLCPTLKDSKKA